MVKASVIAHATLIGMLHVTITLKALTWLQSAMLARGNKHDQCPSVRSTAALNNIDTSMHQYSASSLVWSAKIFLLLGHSS